MENKTLKTIIVDDEKLALENLEYMLGLSDNTKVIGAYDEPLKALEEIKKKKPDVVMLDIEMPRINGFEMAKEIINMNNKAIYIVFITAYNQYALKAFELEAVDYIVKPFSQKRINKTLNMIEKRLHLKGKSKEIKSSIKENLQCLKINKLPVWKKESIILLDLTDIQYITTEEKKTYVYSDNDKYMSSETLGQLEKRLNKKSFFRCYKSFIVNLLQVERIVPMFNQSYILKLKGTETEVPVSRHYSKELKDILKI